MHNDRSMISWRTNMFPNLPNKTKELRVVYFRLLTPPFEKLQIFHLSFLLSLWKCKRSYRDNALWHNKNLLEGNKHNVIYG